MGYFNNWKEAEVPRIKLECNRLHTKILWEASDLVGMEWVLFLLKINKQQQQQNFSGDSNVEAELRNSKLQHPMVCL